MSAPAEFELPDCPAEGDGERHSWIMGAANRCAHFFLQQSANLIREKLTREPSPADEVETAVRKAFSEALDGYVSWQSRTGKDSSNDGSVLSEAERAELVRASRRKSWPVFSAPTDNEIAVIAQSLGIASAAVTIAVERSLLFCVSSMEGPAWLVCDQQRNTARGRRLDGSPWIAVNKLERFLPGSDPAWPVGLDDSKKPVFLRCRHEGAPAAATFGLVRRHRRYRHRRHAARPSTAD